MTGQNGTTIPGDLTPTPLSGYPLAASVSGTDLIFISQGGVSRRATITQALAGSGSAPVAATYFVLSANGDLTNERVLQFNATQFTPVDNGAGLTYVINLNFGSAATPLADAAAAAFGSSIVPARSDHQHPINVSATDPVRTTGNPTPGAQPFYARSDHSHGAPPAFTGASAGVNGTLGGVTQPLAGQQDYFLRADGSWAVAAGTGTVTSVGLALPAEFTVTNSPVITTGTLTGAWASALANRAFMSPDGAPGTPSFRAILPADIPSLDAAKIATGVFPLARGGTNAATAQGARLSILPSVTGNALKALTVNAGETDFEYTSLTSGTVTSIGLAGTAAEITVTGASPITTSGSWTLSLPAALTFTGKTITGGAFTGGTWDNGIIGGSTAAAGTFTALTANTSAVVSVNTATDALRITQIGAGNALLIEDSANPDASPFVVDATGRTLIGQTAAYTNSFDNAAKLQVAVSGSESRSLAQWGIFEANATGGGLQLLKSRGTTPGAHAIVSADDDIVSLTWAASDGVGFINAARINAAVDGSPSVNDMPGRLIFLTTPDGSATLTERMRISNAGVITLGAAVASSSLRVTPTASSVNFIDIAGGASGTAATISAVGAGTDLDLRLTPKGTGYVFATAGGIKFPDNSIQTTAATAGLSLAEVQAAAVSL